MKLVNRREFLRLMAMTAGTGVLAACANPTPTPAPASATEAPKPTEAPRPTVAPTAPSGLSGKKGVMWGLQYDPHVEAYNRLNALLQETTGASVDVQPQAWPLEPKILTAIAGGTGPDVVCIMPDYASTLIRQGAFIPTDDVFKAMKIKPEELWVSPARIGWTVDSKMWGVPVEVGGVGWCVCIDTADVQKANLGDMYPPTNGKGAFESYEQMWELGKALMVKEGDKVKRWGISSQGWDQYSYGGILDSLLAPKGVQWWDDVNKKFYFDTDEGVKAMQLLAETPVKMGIETQLDKNAIDVALAGGVALVRGNGTPATEDGWKLGYHYELVAAPPPAPDKPALYNDIASWGFAGFADAKNKDIAMAYLQMMATDAGQLEYAKIYGGMLQVSYIPLMKAANHFAEGVTKEPLTRCFKQTIAEIVAPNSNGVPYRYNQSELWAKINPSFSDVRMGKVTAAQAVKTMQTNAEAVFKSWQDQQKTSG